MIKGSYLHSSARACCSRTCFAYKNVSLSMIRVGQNTQNLINNHPPQVSRHTTKLKQQNFEKTSLNPSESVKYGHITYFSKPPTVISVCFSSLSIFCI